MHIFGGWVRDPGQTSDLTPWKLRNAAYGRLRFATKIVSATSLRRFLRNYAREDVANFIHVIREQSWAAGAAYIRAWSAFLWNSRRILLARRALQARRVCPDEVLFGSGDDMPPPFFWRDLPLLTWELVVGQYLPFIRSKRTRPMPEFERPPG